MLSKEWRSVTVTVALLLLSLIAFVCCQYSSGDFTYSDRVNTPVCSIQSFDWKTICHEDADCPTRPESGLTTGHFMIGDPSRPDSIKKEAARVEKCYSYCMRTYPPTNAQILAAIRTNPFTMDISSFHCNESLNASLCFSACLHHLKDQLQFTQHANVPSGSCTQLCAPGVERGVCDRAFALRNNATLDEDTKWCNQFCRNETALCEHMCDETLEVLENNTLSQERLPVIREALPIFTRPSENFEWWKNAVMGYRPQLESSFKSNEVYGILWEMSFTLYGNKSYIPQHMHLFFLPDEVMFYRPCPTLLSTPLHQCVQLDARFELIGLDPPHNELSASAQICAQGVAIPDPPEKITALATKFTDYVNLTKLTVHISGHSPEKDLCDNYLVSLEFYNDGNGTAFNKSFSKKLDTFVFEGSDLYWKDRSILDWHFDTKVSCVNWEEEEGFGVDPYNPPLFIRYTCDSTFRTVLYCKNNIQVSGLPVLEPIPNRHTGLWGVNVTIILDKLLVRPTKFLYLSEGQNLTFEMLDGDEVKLNEFIPLQIGKFEYLKTIPFIFPKGAHVGLRGTYGSESQTFLDDTADVEGCNGDCCISRAQKTFEHRIPHLPGIKPSSVRNFTILGFVINEEGVDEKGDKGTIDFSLSWIVPEIEAGGIAMYRIGFGIPQIPNLGTRDIPSNGNVTSTSNPQPVNHTITTGLHRGEVFHFSIEAISIYDEKSDSVELEEIFIPEDNPTGTLLPATLPEYGIAILAILVAAMLAVVIVLTVLVVCLCKRNTKVVIASSHWTKAGEMGEDGAYEPIVSFEPDSWELAPDLITMENLLGEGGFGQVYMGILRGPIRTPGYETGTSLTVAVKLLAMDASPTQKDEFLKEIDLMKRVSLGKCPNIVNTIGCCTLQEPIALVMEYVPYGNLLGYLRTSRKLRYQSGKMHEEEVAKIGNEYITVNIPSDDPNDWKTLRGDPNLNPYSHLGDLEPANLIKFAFQISSGMEYLSSIGVIHRDLACRNILVGEQKMLKICDFGLARENDLYIKTTAGKLPLRWMAIESITERIFTSKSDVWSFGVTLWEIATLGGCPYPAVTNHSLVDYIWSGNRLEKPNNCSMDVYQVMLQCWKASPDDRPSFMELRCLFEGMVNREKNYIDINDEFLPYYPMSAVCDTTGDSLDAPNGGMVSPTPMDYEIPLVFKQGLTGTQKEDEKHILMNEKTTSKDDTEDLTLHAKNPTFSDLASITSEDNDGNKREQ